MKNLINLFAISVIFFSLNAWAVKAPPKDVKTKTAVEKTKAEIAPDFSLTGHDGKTYKLSEVLKEGKHVVLEWFNNECPYVKKHYDSGNMQSLQKKYTDKGVKWFTIISSAKTKQGYMDQKMAAQNKIERKQNATAILLDPKGEVGHLYDAKTTPHMYVINPKGELVYSGAIDSDPNFKPEAIAKATNYVSDALDLSMAGKTIEVSKRKPYGCGVKYN